MPRFSAAALGPINQRSGDPRELIAPDPRDRRAIDIMTEGSEKPARDALVFRARLASLAAVAVLALGLYLLPGRDRIAPLVGGDNVYIFMAVDRLLAGEGLTSLPPVAPLQPWEFTTEWSALTKWPMGYPLVLGALRVMLGVTTLTASQLLCVLACAVAPVGWFCFLRRSLPTGVPGVFLSVVGAASSVSVAALINPATDTLIVALLPWLLLAVHRSTLSAQGDEALPTTRSQARWIALGLAAGGMVWLRYGAVFVPCGIALFVAIEALVLRRGGLNRLACFLFGAALPVALLLLMNHATGSSAGALEQLNLGTRIGFDFSPGMLAGAWWKWTELPFYDYKWYSHWFFALGVPCVPLGLACLSRAYRAELRQFMQKPAYVLGVGTVAALFFVLIASATLFHAKFDFVGLERYYLPIRPLYFLLLVGPISLWRPVVARVGMVVAMVVAGAWFVQQEWPRPYSRWLARRTARTPYGRWERAFSPSSAELYDWAGAQDPSESVLLSNFHDQIALETGRYALPLPRTREQHDRWIARVCEIRDLSPPRILFVIDPDYHNRDYYLPSLDEMIRTFDLMPAPGVPSAISSFVYEASSHRQATRAQQQPPGVASVAEREAPEQSNLP